MRFDEHYYIEKRLPIGFSTDDVESLDQFFRDETKKGKLIDMKIKEEIEEVEEIEEDLDDAEVADVDIEELKRLRLEPKSKGIEMAKKPEKVLHKSNIVDEYGNLIDNDKLRVKLTQRPKNLIDSNVKIGKSGKKTNQIYYDITLPSYQGLYVDEKTGNFKVVRTCPKAGECSKFCYAARGGYIQFPASSLAASRIVNYLMNDDEGFKKQLISELNAAQQKVKGKQVVLRWHDSGDFISENYLRMAYEIAKETPEVLHYAYTKQVPLVKQLLTIQPENFVFNFSFGGLEDELIDTSKDKHARVVPRDMFTDLDYEKTKDALIFTDKSIKTLKQRVADEFGVDVDTVITYDEMTDIEPKEGVFWNTLVWKGHGDDAGSRKDILGVYLLFH